MSSDDLLDIDAELDVVVSDFMDEHELDEVLAEPLTNLLNAVTRVRVEGNASEESDPDATRVGVPTSIRTQQLISKLPEEALERTGIIAVGGMAEIYEVRDNRLHRKLAMKVLLKKFADNDLMRGQFLDEAQITAQLSHPGIPPVYEICNPPGERPYFTMQRVLGVTLSRLLRRFHQLSAASPNTMSEAPSASHASLQRPVSKVVTLPDSETSFSGEPLGSRPLASDENDALELMQVETWTPARMLSVFLRICEAVGYAHARGVVHRDLKPANLMVGAFGEVLVMDWGLAVVGEPTSEALVPEEPIRTVSAPGQKAVVGGTPGYMAPEQAMRDGVLLTPAADVFALGIILFEIVTGARPYRGTASEVIQKALNWELERPILPSYLDDGLWSIITKALSPDPAHRYQEASALAVEVERWSEGALRREKAVGLVMEAMRCNNEVEPKCRKATILRRKAAKLLAKAGESTSSKIKARVWRLEDLADQLEREAGLIRVEVTHLLHSALTQAPDLTAAHRELASIYHANHVRAENDRDRDLADRHEMMLRAHDRGEFVDYLSGKGTLSVAADAPCKITAYWLIEKERRLVRGPVRRLGAQPVVGAELEIGSYLLELTDSRKRTLPYPIVVERRSGWDGLRPDGTPLLIPVSALATLDEDEVLVAAGWFTRGGDPQARMPRNAKKVWCETVAMSRFPVTMKELAAFLGTLYGAPWRDTVLRDGLEIWRPDWPAVGITLDCARAYATWKAELTQKPWRLPTGNEWEKVARGPDGRRYPWGDFGDVLYCHVRDGSNNPTGPVSVYANPMDCSLYGVWGLGGNVREWVESDDDQTWVRGGSWRQPMVSARSASRVPLSPAHGYPDVGFRLVRSL